MLEISHFACIESVFFSPTNSVDLLNEILAWYSDFETFTCSSTVIKSEDSWLCVVSVLFVTTSHWSYSRMPFGIYF